MSDIKGTLSIGGSLSGNLNGHGFTLPIATAIRLGCVKIGEGLKTNADGILKVLYNNNMGLFINDNGELIVNIGQGLYYDADGKICVNESFDISGLRDDINRLDVDMADLMDVIDDIYVSKNTYISSQIYEVITDSNGCATLPFAKDSQIACVYVNGVFAIADKDYQIIDDGIEVTHTDLTTGNDVVSIVVFKPTIDNANDMITISSQIYETQIDSNRYAQLPFTYNNQMFYVFVNGVFVSEKDYQVTDGGVLLTDSEFLFGNDVVTFVIFKPLVNGVESNSTNFALKTYNVQTDKNSNASIPLVPKVILKNNDSSAIQVYINGLLGVEGKDYQIKDGQIKLISSEFFGGNDVVTFAVFQAELDDSSLGGPADNITTISIAEINEIINS